VNSTYLNRNWRVDSLLFIDLPILLNSYNKMILLEEKVSEHIFDLLGAGEVRVHYGLDAKGLERYKYPPLKVEFQFDQKGLWLERFINRSNLAYSRKV